MAPSAIVTANVDFVLHLCWIVLFCFVFFYLFANQKKKKKWRKPKKKKKKKKKKTNIEKSSLISSGQTKGSKKYMRSASVRDKMNVTTMKTI